MRNALDELLQISTLGSRGPALAFRQRRSLKELKSALRAASAVGIGGAIVTLLQRADWEHIPSFSK